MSDLGETPSARKLAGNPDSTARGPSAPRVVDRVRQSLDAEERAGLRLEIRGRTIALLAIAVLTCFWVTFPGMFYYHALIAVFIGLGFLRLWARGRSWHRDWHAYAFVSLDFALLVFTLLSQNPLAPVPYPPQVILRFDNVIYCYVLMVGLAFSFRPRLVLWGGLMAALSWAAGVAWLASLDDSTIIPITHEQGPHGVIEALANPTHVDLGVAAQNVAILLVVSGLIAAIVWRSRSLVLRQALIERERSNLARYFPPATVDRLARHDSPFDHIREQDAAVLFVDLRHFTSWSEHHEPADVIALLRRVHAHLVDVIFAHHGTVDKFIGDGMMATFGTLDPCAEDATNALACFRAILTDFKDGVPSPRADGSAPLTLSAGLHYGPVVVGDIGGERRLELAVLGDTVNVASRLETVTRALDTRGVISGEMIAAVRREALPQGDILLDGFVPRGPQTLRGRGEPVEVWSLDPATR